MASLVADYGSSSASESEGPNAQDNSSSDDDAEENGAEHFTDKNDHRKLPVPSFQSSTVGSSSVFSNPFREEEYAQCSVLERHVKMTTPVSQQTQVQGKQICWNYRKGRCRFGHNCKYLHDSDVLGLSGAAPETTPEVQLVASSEGPSPNEAASLKRKKKRPGLPDGINLSKKAMKFYHKTRGKPA